MITYSGLLFFITTYMVLGFNLSFNVEQQDEFYDKVFPDTVTVKKADDYQPLASLSQMYQVTKEHWLQDTLEQVEVKYPLDKNARIKFTRKETDITYNPQDELFFAGISGVLLDVPDKPSTISGQIDDGFISLHEGQFATPIVRWLYLLVGLLGAGMVASGLILWTTKRKPKQVKKANGPDFGYRLVEQLNIGTIVGFPIAVAVYFWANRLLPVSIENRGEWEMHCLFISWALLLIYPAFRPAINAWYEQLNLSAFMFCFIPLLNYMTTDKHLGVTLPQGDWNLAGFDLTMLVIGLAFAFAGYKVKKQITVKVRKTNNTTKDNIGKSIVTRRLTPLVTSKESQQ
jgi:hypothetical protein